MDKNYVVDEYQRNIDSKALYTGLLKAAFGHDAIISVSHHISVRLLDAAETVHEIPSADTVLFDHQIMGKVFGKARAVDKMAALARLPPHRREAQVKRWLSEVGRRAHP